MSALPCDQCDAPCCVWPGHTNIGGVPTDASGRCVNLSADNRCMDYANRPKVCRDFDCRTFPGFMEAHPRVRALIRGMRV